MGAPLRDYGPRLTLNAGPDPSAQARRLGFADHPWGPPTWYGLRVAPSPGDRWDGEIRVKPYHRMSTLPAGVQLPAGMPSDLGVDLAARDGDRTEVYFRRTVLAPWLPFAETALALVGATAPDFPLSPRAVVGAHCLSLSWTGRELTAVTVYAQDRCLPDDRTIAAAWVRGLADADRRTYEAALGGVRSLGRPGAKSFHGLLSWSAAADGSSSRAVSLRVHDPLTEGPLTGEPAPHAT